MRPKSVVPLGEKHELAAQGLTIHRHQDAAKRLGLHGADETLHDGDAAVLADSPESLANPAPPAPPTEASVGELCVTVR
jgi:hypothetical protein